MAWTNNAKRHKAMRAKLKRRKDRMRQRRADRRAVHKELNRADWRIDSLDAVSEALKGLEPKENAKWQLDHKLSSLLRRRTTPR